MSNCYNCQARTRPKARFCGQCGTKLVLGGEYRIISVIKSGGMGKVYKAQRRGKLVALKEMLDRFADNKQREDAINRFMAEAFMLVRLTHQHIPDVYRNFIENGRFYLAMDFIAGEDLHSVLSHQGGKALPEEDVLKWALQICEVLEYLHQQEPSVIFRDLKPANIMLKPNGDISLVDFGIARLFEPHRKGTLIGTPGYAPPEQWQGLAEPRSDIYALASTLHHLLTGRDPTEHPPFTFPKITTINPLISPELETIIHKALEMRVDDRYASVSDMRKALEALTLGTVTDKNIDLPDWLKEASPSAAQESVELPDWLTTAPPAEEPPWLKESVQELPDWLMSG